MSDAARTFVDPDRIDRRHPGDLPESVVVNPEALAEALVAGRQAFRGMRDVDVAISVACLRLLSVLKETARRGARFPLSNGKWQPMQSLNQVGPAVVAELLHRAAAAFRALGDALEALDAFQASEAAEPEPPNPAHDEILTVAEAAAEFKRSESFIRQQCREGRLKAMKGGKTFRIRRSALLAYERRRTGIGVLHRVGIVAALALLGSAAQADVFDAAAIGAAASDVVTTELALKRGFVEQNIANRPLRIGANVLLTSGVLLAAREVEKGGHKGWARAIKVGYTLAFAGIAAKNIHTMRTARIR